MQTTIHVKASFENEFRRFALPSPPTFKSLYLTLGNLFGTKDFKVKFLDDESDWVLLTTDQELLYAAGLAGSPLRLQVKLTGGIDYLLPAEENAGSVQLLPTEEPRRWRGRGRGGYRGGRGERSNTTKEERLTLKASRLSTRISSLESKLNSEQPSNERDQVLHWRLQQLQDKLEFVKATKLSLEEAAAAGVDTSACRGFGRGRGRGGCWRSKIPPEIWTNFMQCKRDLQEARASGNPEQLQAATLAFVEAKRRKLEAKQCLKAERLEEETKEKAEIPAGDTTQ